MAIRSPMPAVSRRSRVLLATVVVLLFVVTTGSAAISLYADSLWFGEVGFSDVFATQLRTRALLFLIFGLAMALVVGGNLYAAFRLRPSYRPMSLEQQNLERYRLALTPRIRWVIAAAAGAVGLITGVSAQGRWQTWLLWRNGTSFGQRDAQFGRDVSFYMFDLPFYRFVLGIGFTAVVLSALGALFLHYLYGAVRLQGTGERMSLAARSHLSVLLGLFVALKAVAYYFDRFALVFGQSDLTNVTGASYTDVNALLPAKNILLWVAAICAVIVFVNIAVRNLLLPVAALVLLVLSAVLVGGVYPAVVEQFQVRPNVTELEAKFIKRNIDATRQAYGIQDFDQIAYPARTTATQAELRGDTATIPNTRLLDPSKLAPTFTQLQQVRSFYDFPDKLDVDRYTVGGETQDYVVGVRELSTRELDGNQTNWINRTTVFTHGNGFVAAPANRVDNRGAPVFVSGRLGGEESADEFVPVQQPRIYYGELIGSYAVVGKAEGAQDGEFDRPTAVGGTDTGEQVNYSYTGRGGVQVGSFARQLLYGVYFRERNFVLSGALNENSKVLYVRNPRDRVEKVAPFLKVDGDPYPAVIDGRVQWILDGYTTSNNYPYAQRQQLREAAQDALTGTGTAAQPEEPINYIRNSVKATVDAYDGTVRLYAVDENDPVLKTWDKAFGGIIRPKSEIPPALAAHFRYPEDLFKVQREMLRRYHVTDPEEFFQAQDFWKVPDDPTDDKTAPQPPYYLLAQFPEQDRATFQLTSALTANRRENLAALVNGSLAPDGTPRLQVYELPGDSPIFGPNQVQQRMTNQPAARDDLLAFRSGDSSALFGNLLTLPVGGGLLYVEPLYVQGRGENAFPLLTKVLLAFGERVAYENTLPEALDALFGAGSGGSPPVPPGNTQTPTPTPTPSGSSTGVPPPGGEQAAAIAAISAAIADLRAAQQRGDFAAVGKAQADLDAATKRFEAAQGRSASPAPATTTAPSAPAGG